MAIKKKVNRKLEIDLNGPQGNAFYLIGFLSNTLKRSGLTEDVISEIIEDMKSSDYEHLIQVFDKHLGSIVDLVR